MPRRRLPRRRLSRRRIPRRCIPRGGLRREETTGHATCAPYTTRSSRLPATHVEARARAPWGRLVGMPGTSRRESQCCQCCAAYHLNIVFLSSNRVCHAEAR